MLPPGQNSQSKELVM